MDAQQAISQESLRLKTTLTYKNDCQSPLMTSYNVHKE